MTREEGNDLITARMKLEILNKGKVGGRKRGRERGEERQER